ncbi:MAG: hypothetical protein WBA39_02715 [Rivularia sp. (in: cyanobacteria)]
MQLSILIDIHQFINYSLVVISKELDISQFIKCYLLAIPLIFSLVIEDQWVKTNIIKNVKQEPMSELFIHTYLIIFNVAATVIAYNIFYSLNIPIISKTFLIIFVLLSVLWGIYLLYLRIRFKYEE